MNAHQHTISLGAGDNNALWLVQRKAQAQQQMRDRLRHHFNVVCKETKRLGKEAQRILIRLKKYLPFGYVNEFVEQTYGCPIPSAPVVVLDAKNQVSRVSRALGNTKIFRAVKELKNLVAERQRELETLRRQQNLVKLKAPGSEACVKLKKLHATSLSIPPAAAPRFGFH
jgi:hypothetical protein